jgi:uncharacterized protein (TIGR00290 family)
MKAFVSWSGGKDCMLALHRIVKEGSISIHCLLNMCDKSSPRSRSHGLDKSLVKEQARCMGIPILQPLAGDKDYENVFKATISELRSEGVEVGIFGDIYLQEHRTWIERVCTETGIEPLFPLWNNKTPDLIREFVDQGFKSKLVAVNQLHLPESWLGRTIDQDFVADILKLEHIDPCAEMGEYHSFVYDGPLFQTAVPHTETRRYAEKGHWFLDLCVQKN